MLDKVMFDFSKDKRKIDCVEDYSNEVADWGVSGTTMVRVSEQLHS